MNSPGRQIRLYDTSNKVTTFLGLLALLLTVTSTAFSILFAVLLTRAQLYIHGVAIAASTLNSMVSALLLATLIRQFRGRQFSFTNSNERGTSYALLFAVAFLFVGAASLNLTALIWTQLHSLEAVRTSVSSHIFDLIKAAFCFCGSAVVAQFSFAFAVAQQQRPADFRQTLGEHEKGDAYPDAFEHIVPKTSHSTPSTDSQSASEQLRNVTALSAEADESRRSSYQQVLQRSRLEPIPGSRPDSPAHPLDGPFLPDSKLGDSPSRDSSRPVTASSKSSSPSINETRIAPRFRTSASRSTPSSPVIDESLIHPLFRSDSPLPPPTPTLGTTVTASAFGGRVMSSRSLSGASSRSRSVSPAFTITPANRSRAGSVNSSSVHLGSRVGQTSLSRSQSLEAIKSGKVMTITRGHETPPVPDLPSPTMPRATADATPDA